MGDRPNLKLSRKTGEETRDALKKYRDAYNLSSQEEAIRQLLPKWAFNPLIPPSMGRIKDMAEKSRNYDIHLSDINDIGDLSELLNKAEQNGDAELAAEIEEIIQSHSFKEKSE